MEAKPLTNEANALTKKKMDMSLDQIIKMSKNKGNTTKKSRVPNKNQRTFNSVPQDKSTRVRRFMNSRASVRQGAISQRKSHFQGNHLPLANDAARKAAVAPFCGTAVPRDMMVNSNRARGGANTRPQRNASIKEAERGWKFINEIETTDTRCTVSKFEGTKDEWGSLSPKIQQPCPS